MIPRETKLAANPVESHAGVRYRAPFALRCGALLIDYILLALILTFSIMVARLMGGGARLAAESVERPFAAVCGACL